MNGENYHSNRRRDETKVTKATCERVTKALDDPSNYKGGFRPGMTMRISIKPNPEMMAAYKKLVANGGHIHIDTGRAVGKRAFAEFLREQGMTIIDASVERPDGIET